MKPAKSVKSLVKPSVDPAPRRALQTTDEVDKKTEIATARDLALVAITVEDIQRLDRVQLLDLQRILQHGDTFGVWVTPQKWLVTSVKKSNGLSRSDMRQRIIDCLPENLRQIAKIAKNTANADHSLALGIEQALLTLTRYLILLRMGPVGRFTANHRSLAVSTISQFAYTYGPQLLALGLAKRVHLATVAAAIGLSSSQEIAPESDILTPLTMDDLAALTPNSRKCCLAECDRMRRLQDMGLWWDTPSLKRQSRSRAMKGKKSFTEKPEEKDAHKPLPDEYVAQMGERSLWLIQDLAPNLLNIAAEMADLWTATSSMGLAPSTVADKRNVGVRAILDRHEWRDHKGRAFKNPPFSLKLPMETGIGKINRVKKRGPDPGESVWPPRTYMHIKGLLGVVQAAHYFVAALSMGSRQSETLSLQRNCVVYATDNRPYANGRTYKLQQRHDGQARDWLLPDYAVKALEQQTRLVRLTEYIAAVTPKDSRPAAADKKPTHLWAQISARTGSDATRPLLDINQALVRHAIALNMSTAPGGQKLRSHRLRKTLARLVALALTQAPKILMDVFGHKSIEMTLHYILSDKALRADIETVSRELRVMRCKEVVDRMVEADSVATSGDADKLAGYGGLSAVIFRDAVKSYRERVHRRGEQWGVQSAVELAQLLTLQGTAWEQVRKGVICTKFPGQAGPCNKRLGRPEPSKCQSTCNHRLEEAFLRDDVDGAIEDALRAYENETASGELLSAAFWAGQLRAHVPRFPDLRKKWMTHATVRSLLDGRSGDVAT